MSYVKKSLFIVLNQEKPDVVISNNPFPNTVNLEDRVFERKKCAEEGMNDLLLYPRYKELEIKITGVAYFYPETNSLNTEQLFFLKAASSLKYAENLHGDRLVFHFIEDRDYDSLGELDDEFNSREAQLYSDGETYALSFPNISLQEDEWKTFDELDLKVTKI